MEGVEGMGGTGGPGRDDDDGGISILLSISLPDLREMMAFTELDEGFSEV